ncbi:Piwi domain-containing protein [Blyttiomyces helicus]|uniref:Piwi domain-containing protein n=1 Tax=Blyttiomyces helicus TaxID=388810 RepID=A0A4P9WAC5_9FUNG|nr:Piwi domain-containing protein [Blyttiomyces helicus]|eukprot:RKO87186.1 Piwi domain-containing protein [Blyttiomyces helicus]
MALDKSSVIFAQRPGEGVKGRMTKIRTNYIPVLELPTEDIHHYDVSFTPELPPVLFRKLFKAFEAQHHDSPEIGGMFPVFDGRKNMFSARKLPFGEAHTFDVVARKVQRTQATAAGRETRGPRVYRMRCKRVASIKMQNLHDFLAGRTTSTPFDAIMALDIVLRHKPSTGKPPQYVTVGRSFYTQIGAQSLRGGAEVWPGYHQSIRPAGKGMKINIDVSSTAFYEAGPLLSMVQKILKVNNVNDLRRPVSDVNIKKLEKTLKGLRVVTSHRGAAGRKRYRIAKLGESSKSSTFEFDGQKSTVAVYFKSKYGKDLEFPDLPVLIVGDPKKNMLLPMEVVDVVEGQRHTRKLDERQTAEMIKFTCQPPHVRSAKISQGVTLFDYEDNPYMHFFGIKVEKDLALVPARVMPIPKLMFGGSSEIPRDGVWALKEKKLYEGAGLKSWGVIAFFHEREGAPGNFISELVRTLKAAGLVIPNEKPFIMHANPAQGVEGAMKQCYLSAGNESKSRPQLIVCVLPNTGVPLYAEIKRVSDTVLGIPTQCIQKKHMETAKRQYCQNVALKMNVKLGGGNFYVDPTGLPFVTSKPTIIIGADVTHSSPTEGNKPSVVALVGSIDAKCAKYAAVVKVKPPAEVYKEMSLGIIDLLKTFYQTSKRKPDQIIFYRDGVSEGQFGEVMSAEINAVRRACHAVEKGYKPPITYIVVQKRHHTRFFPLEKKDEDRSGNVMPGTIVESQICHPTEFDFFLMSHPGLQGTSRPCHYNVLFDENKLSSDIISAITYQLAYHYARATRAVSIVTPAYYANLVASRARYHAKGEHWSDSESESGRLEASYAPVKPELVKSM